MSDQPEVAPKLDGRIVRGLATRARIVTAASELMFTNGVNATTLDDVREASSTSKSQLYHNFANKNELVLGVIESHSNVVLAREYDILQSVDSFEGLQRWAAALVELKSTTSGSYGCVIGSMASELSDQSEGARVALDRTFQQWTRLLEDALRRMRDSGEFDESVDLASLATFLLSIHQGGHILARTGRDVSYLKTSLDVALSHIRTLLRR